MVIGRVSVRCDGAVFCFMQLPSFKSHQPNTDTRKVLTACIAETSITLAVWEVNSKSEAGDQRLGEKGQHQQVKVLEIGTPKEWVEENELVDAWEFGLTELKQQAQGISEVLLGLPDEWVKGNDIIPEKKKLLQHICKQTKLTPIGFVVSHEALWKYLSVKSGAANSALFFEISSGEISLSLIEHGLGVQHESVGRSEVVIDDLQEAIARIEKKPFPPQVFFFSSILSEEQLQDIKNEFLHFDWLAQGSFSRIPEVEVLEKTIVVQAISEIGGKEVLQSQKKSEEKNEAMMPNTPSPTSPEFADALAVGKKHPNTKEQPSPFDFEEVTKAKAPDRNISAFGVPMATPVVPATAPSAEMDNQTEADDELPFTSASQTSQARKSWWPFGKKNQTSPSPRPKPAGQIDSTPNKPLRPAFVFNLAKFKLLPVIAVVALVAIISGYFFLRSQVKAQVKVFLKTETVQKDVQITLDENASGNPAETGVLKASTVTKEVSGSQETSTTGSKLIGEKATGTVTIFNGTENTKTFEKGTELQVNSKKYLLDEEVTVASATAKIDSNLNKTLESGKKDAKVVAADIGAEYNVGANTEFVIANFSKDTYMARNEKDISGGSSRETQAVSKEDQQKLLESLRKELTEQAEKELNEQKQDGQYLVIAGTPKIIDSSYSAEVGEETQTLKLTASVEATAYVYQAEDLRPLAENTLVSLVPEGGALLADTINILSKQSETASGSATVKLDAQLSAQYTPPTNSDEWVQQISGRTLEQAQRLLEEKSEISAVEISLQPSIAQTLFGNMPKDTGKIQLIKEVK